MSPVKQEPSRPKKVSNKRMKPLPKTEKKFEDNEVAKPTSLDTNKYAPKPLVGEATIHRPNDDMITKVGLGNLETITNYGNQPDV